MDYHFSGQVSQALPVPALWAPHFRWVKDAIDPRLNGLLVIWYDGALGHYIGKRRDSINNMVAGAPIVTLSFGERPQFRLRPWRDKGKQFVDFPATDGTVFILPYDTNLSWTHEVPHRAADRGRRISVTLRAFHPARPEPVNSTEPQTPESNDGRGDEAFEGQ